MPEAGRDAGDRCLIPTTQRRLATSQCAGIWAERGRRCWLKPDQWRITSGTLRCCTRASCTGSTCNRIGGPRCAGIMRRPGPRTDPRPGASIWWRAPRYVTPQRGLFCGSSHEPSHADRGQQPVAVTECSGRSPLQRAQARHDTDRTVERVTPHTLLTLLSLVVPRRIAELVIGVPAGTSCGRENRGWLPADAGSAWCLSP